MTPVVKSLSNNSKKGPKGYNIRSIIRTFIAQRIVNIPTRAALVHRLKSDPVFSHICGFGFFSKVPSEATLSRYFTKLSGKNSLETILHDLLDKAHEMEIINPETAAIVVFKT